MSTFILSLQKSKMNRKKYRVTIKMVKTITMDHEQTSMIKAKEDVKKVCKVKDKIYV